MAHTKSALKFIRTSKKRQARNKAIKSTINTLERKFRETVEAKDKEAATEALRSLISKIDKGIKSNNVHKNKAARKKQRLTALINAL